MPFRRPLLVLSYIFFMSVAPLTATAAVDCQQALRFLDETLTVPPDSAGSHLAKEGPFHDWLAANSLDWQAMQAYERHTALGNFYAGRLQPYLSSNQAEVRGQSLSEELTYRGALAAAGENDGDGYARLRQLSRDNRARLMAGFMRENRGPWNTDDFPSAEVDRKLKLLELVFVHNTTSLTNRPSFPLLSSRELIQMGITGKLNSGKFNRFVLKNDGNLFFFAIPHLRSGPFPKVSSQYGDVSLILANSFAEQYGWISPFVMYESDLMDLAAKAWPGEFAVLSSWLAGHSQTDAAKIPADQWDILIRRLHSFDLTVQDTTNLMRDSLRLSLQRLWSQDRTEFHRVMKELGSGYELGPVLERYSLGRMGIPFDNPYRALELKVPVSVPPGSLDIRLDSDALGFGSTALGRTLPIPKGPLLRGWNEPDPF